MTTDQPLYSVAARTKEFIAQHFLVGGDWGRANELHSYRYRIEARYEGPSLDQYGFLLDITEVEGKLSGLVERYEDHTLNELPEFEGLNPSVENVARVSSDGLIVAAPNVSTLAVTVWEDDQIASYRRPLDSGNTA